MFRYRSLCILPLAVMVAILFSGVPSRGAYGRRPDARPAERTAGMTKPGIDVLEEQDFLPLRGKRIGLITNQTGVDSRGRRTIDVLAHAPGVQLAALFSPEHGMAGARDDAKIPDTTDAATGLPIYSLYGETRRPTNAMLANIDALVFDVQDAGVRFYTYLSTMAYCLEAAASHHLSYFVLDRPDPLGGEVIEGPMLDPGKTSFTGYFPMPVRYAMTIGEFARMFNAETRTGADLHVISMKDWHRSWAYDQTGLAWRAPSPNLRTVTEDFLYPGIEILQAAGVSVGRGTDAPFELLGAPWIRANVFVAALDRRRIPGVSFAPTRFTPNQDPYDGQVCQGAILHITDRDALGSMRMGIEIADVLHRMYPKHFELASITTLLGSQITVDRLSSGESPSRVVAGWSSDLERFRKVRANYLLYY
jgi:uncharacterized protein YbbC (DUF1343 family)